MKRWSVGIALLGLCLCGCRFGVPPDPNDPAQAGVLQPIVLKRDLKGASDSLLERLVKGEISNDQYRAKLAEAATDLLSKVDISKVPDKLAWEYGDIYRTAHRWDDAKKLLQTAVKVAKNEDRRVNDSLRLAQVEAELGDLAGAIAMAKSVMNTPDNAAAPILPAVLLEIVPSAEKKASTPALAELLEQAIGAEMRTVVDPNTKPGRDFLIARPFHVRRAWIKVVEIYAKAGKLDQAAAAKGRGDTMLRTLVVGA